MISKFRNEYFFLSNFYPCEVKYGGLTYQCSEAAFQAQKFEDIEIKKKFTTMDGKKAKYNGSARAKLAPLRSDWDSVKNEIMLDVNVSKYTQNPDLMQKLLDTGDEYIAEGNVWRDTYWGVYNGKGKNVMGNILMVIRTHFKNEKLL